MAGTTPAELANINKTLERLTKAFENFNKTLVEINTRLAKKENEPHGG